jgi:hypothetical protein
MQTKRQPLVLTMSLVLLALKLVTGLAIVSCIQVEQAVHLDYRCSATQTKHQLLVLTMSLALLALKPAAGVAIVLRIQVEQAVRLNYWLLHVPLCLAQQRRKPAQTGQPDAIPEQMMMPEQSL